MKTIAIGFLISAVISATIVSVIIDSRWATKWYFDHVWGQPTNNKLLPPIPAQYVELSSTKKAPVV